MTVQRISQVIGVKPELIKEYEEIHSKVWPEVLATLKRCNIQNFSIYRYENLLFSYMEYIGEDLETDLARIAEDPKTREWWQHTEPMQNPVLEKSVNEWWHVIPEVFHMN